MRQLPPPNDADDRGIALSTSVMSICSHLGLVPVIVNYQLATPQAVGSASIGVAITGGFQRKQRSSTGSCGAL